ncbi:gamma carbonic anhydrase family protein [uncultured Microbulbifer sp.]|uniref:gamma carbonic anhydrase family protein n=1 Tax=uncultured Microbulbifer sp. TaxID=348147 RepID=UPI002623A063|nr:gamma carbonic anhydrase family protein [uncultured Microbulbifer sp.]
MSPLRSYSDAVGEKAPQIGKGVYIDPQSTVIGDVCFGDDCSVWPMAVVRGDMHRIQVGARTSVQDGAVLHITHAGPFNPDGWPLVIGEDVTIGHKACLHGCTLGSRVLVGIGAIVLDGAIIGDDVVLAAGALVPPGKTLQSGYLYVGAPCKKVRALTAGEKAFFRYSAENYVKLKDRYLMHGRS